MDCGSGLLLLLTRTIRQIDPGRLLLVRTEEPSVPPDLQDWARLAGHAIVGSQADSVSGPWQITIRRGDPRPAAGVAATAEVFTTGGPTPLGERLWLYSNFHCNLSCGYCCAASSPRAAARLLPVAVALAAADEFRALGGRELILTGGEPFLHPEIGSMVTQLATRLPVTVLTNAMVFDRGRRSQALQGMPRDRVVLQVSLDSADATLHDRHRGAGSHARALKGIGHAKQLGFTVKVAATLYDGETASATALHTLLDTLDIAEADRLIRPVARQGTAQEGQPVTIDTLQPEPTLAVDGLWWHPVAVTDPAMQVATTPLPLAAAFETIRDTQATQDAARSEGRRHVFRCA
jgi:pyruvate-formate lyase-activating enzyme/TusA-related sulfurtransferase